MADFELDAELAYAAWLADEEAVKQGNIVMARRYFEGDHDAKLTERQKEFLYHQGGGDERFAVNYCAMIVKAVFERMIVSQFDGEDEALSAWAWEVWQQNRMDALQVTVHQQAITDGECFVFVGWDDERGRPVFIPHPRYTDPIAGGTGFGCKAFYPDDDPSYPLEHVAKRWTETFRDDRGRRHTRRRMNVYYPDRVERLIASSENDSGWALLKEEEEDTGIVPWLDKRGEGLGIPFVHFYNHGRRSELWDAIPLQDLINKTALDIIATADACGFPIRFVDFRATTDGLEPASNGSNLMKVFPGAWIEMPKGSTVETIPPSNIVGLMDALDSWIVKLAQVTDTPTSRLQVTGQVAAEGTLKQQEGPLLAKVRLRQTLFGNAWEDAIYFARKLANFQGQGLGEVSILSTLWEPSETRDDKAFREAMVLEMQMGVPREKLWAKLGYNEDEIAKMKAMSAEEMQERANIGGELLKQFESGGFGGGGQEEQEQGGVNARSDTGNSRTQ